MNTHLSEVALSFLPIGSVVKVKINGAPAVLIRTSLGWGSELHTDSEVAAMEPTLATTTPREPVRVRTLPGFTRDSKARSATRRRERGAGLNDSTAGRFAQAG